MLKAFLVETCFIEAIASLCFAKIRRDELYIQEELAQFTFSMNLVERNVSSHHPPDQNSVSHTLIHDIIAHIDFLREPPIMQEMTRPQREDDALGILVPTLTTRMKDAELHHILNVILVLPVDALFDVDRGDISVDAAQNGVHAESDLTLDHPNDRVVSQTNVGAKQIKHIRKIWTGNAKKGVGRLAPDLAQILTVFADDGHILATGHQVKSRRVNDGVEFQKLFLLLISLLNCDAFGKNSVDPVRDQSDFGRVKTFDVIVRDRDSFAPHLKVRNQLFLQFRIVDLTMHELDDLSPKELPSLRSFLKSEEEVELLAGEDVPTMELHEQRKSIEKSLDEMRVEEIETRRRPNGRPLEDGD